MYIEVEYRAKDMYGKFRTHIVEFEREDDFKEFCQSEGIIIMNVDCKVRKDG